MYYPLAWYTGPDTSIDPFEQNRQKQVVGLIRTNFLKRLESSVAAFELSCERLLKKLLAFLEVHSETAAEKYAEFLKVDFPRLPLTGSLELFLTLNGLGDELVALHLLESPKLDHVNTTHTGPRNPEVGRVSWSDEAVWLDAATTKKGHSAKPSSIGFHGVPEAVWNFHIGGYQVCQKWLKDRKDRTLSDDDIIHYQKIVVALSETIRLMREIDEVIEQHGGWPGAFAPSAARGT
jgi:predicted helicase